MAASTAIAAVVSTIASTAVAYKGAQDAAAAARTNATNQRNAAEYQATVDRNTANYQMQVASNNAEAIRRQGDAAAAETQRQNSARLGAQRASFAAMGLDPNQGSALTIQDDTAASGGLDVANTRYNALLRGMGLDQEATLYGASGRNALTAGAFRGALAGQAGEIGARSATMQGYGSLLSGASQFSSRWSTFQQSGGFGALVG